MNVFEDLVIELQEENLLEKTQTGNGNGRRRAIDLSQGVTIESFDLSKFDVIETPAEHVVTDYNHTGVSLDPEIKPLGEAPAIPPIPKKPRNGKEFYKKRAVSEVSNLQMVEHVLTGVEREYMKVKPRGFDDFKVKKTLNGFLQVTDGENSTPHKEAEFALMQETEAWCSALAERDKNVPVGLLRQYCENSRPALSSQALLALARFYRNLPYSEAVRSKFDFVITRLFSRPGDGDLRICLFTREEALTHVNTLYREWSSVSLYDVDDDDSKVKLTAMSFDDLSAEAAQAVKFDQLIDSDFFGRLRSFKESISELFYAPQVVVAAIEANIRIGNSYVNLIQLERRRMDDNAIQSKYVDFNVETISDAAGRTLELVDLLRTMPVNDQPFEAEAEAQSEPPAYTERLFEKVDVIPEKPARVYPPLVQKLVDNAKKVNRWFLACSILLIVASVGIYIWANFYVVEEFSTSAVRKVEIEKTPLAPVAKTSRISGDNMYYLLKSDWDALPREKRQEYLQKAYQYAVENRCKRVTLTYKDGRQAGFASATKLEVAP